MAFPFSRTGSLRALLAWGLATGLVASPAAAELTIHAGSGDGRVHLVGEDDGGQVVVLAEGDRDVTRQVDFSIRPPDLASVDDTGYVTPRRNGEGELVAKASAESGSAVRLPIRVRRVDDPPPVSFPNDVVPIFTRNHCNAGACHAKSNGQNGFKLSLLGFDPAADYREIVEHGSGRRVSSSAPAHSLLLLKPTGDIPHKGGARLEKDSPDYELIRRWIEGGAAFRPEGDPTVERIEVHPKSVVTQPEAAQQLAVTAFFSDGTTRDVTRAVQYEPNQPDMAEADETGLVHIGDDPGKTAVLVRFQQYIDTFTATIPLGGEPPQMPEPKNFIDEHIFSQLRLMRLPPSGGIDDHTFLRRVTLDIAGRIPTLEETRSFRSSDAPDKRARKIDELLAGADYANFFAGKWAAILRNKVNRGRPWVWRDSHAFHAWIRKSLNDNKPYDQFASELILASGKAIENPAVNWYRVVEDDKERTENVAQAFLGVRLQCAQCHQHPFDQWSQADYYAFTAFFSTVERKNVPKLPEDDILHHNREPALMKNPATQEKLKPRLLGRDEPLDISARRDPRRDLAEWMRSEDNPYFARMLASRYWKHFFGRGLVEPEDDLRPTNPPTHPALLDELAASFVDSGFDLKDLIRTICNSRSYQLSSRPNGRNAEDEQNYARYYPKRLDAEVLLDSINDITGAETNFKYQPDGVRAIALANEKGTKESQFLMMFGRPAMDTACECERSSKANLGQSLHLLNADSIQEKLTANDGRAAKLAEDSERSDEEKITELYLHALSREPEAAEMNVALGHLEQKRKQSAADPKKLPAARAEREAFEDIVWAMINTKEFMFVR